MQVDIDITGEASSGVRHPAEVERVLEIIENAFSRHTPAPKVTSHAWHNGLGRCPGFRVTVIID